MKNTTLTYRDSVNKNTNTNIATNTNVKLEGWTYFNKKELNKKYEKEDNKNVKNTKKRKEERTKDIYKFYEKLSIRWNNYRDEKNYLWGDTSPYINYKDDIEKIVNEENMILEEIYNTSTNYSSSSDDDFN